jgi:hypothetical protein
MEDQECHGPTDLPCPLHPWSEIAIEGIAGHPFISDGAEHVELTRLNLATRLSGQTGPQTHR